MSGPSSMRGRLLKWYARICAGVVSTVLVVGLISAALSNFFPQLTTSVVGKALDSFDGADGCIGGNLMQQREFTLFHMNFSMKYFDETCADMASALQFLSSGLAHGQPEFVVLSLSVLRQISNGFAAASEETISILHNDVVDMSGIDGSRCVWSSWSGDKNVMVNMQCPKG